jgi:hypothetical protein
VLHQRSLTVALLVDEIADASHSWSHPGTRIGPLRSTARLFVRSGGSAESGNENSRRVLDSSGCVYEVPALTYFRANTIIGPDCLTSVFGMGTGISSRVWAPGFMRRRRTGCEREELRESQVRRGSSRSTG